MKKKFLFLIIGLLFNTSLIAQKHCFIVKENNKTLKIEGNCNERYAPESTFKIALSLMGFDAGILDNKDNPSWICKDGCNYGINVCKGAHNPRTWLRDSCLWYSQILTTKLGISKFSKYVKTFNYGNMDLTGDKGKNNGLTRSWVSSSLKISAKEQIEFLRRVTRQKLPLSKISYLNTKKIMFMQELPGG